MTAAYAYDAQGRVARQVVDGTPIDFAYTKEGRLAGKWLGGRERPDASVEYARDGRIAARTANGVRQTFEHDARGRLLAVKESGKDVERYAYDRAGNMVRKTVRGRTTEFAFDGANQLVSSTAGGVTTRYAYDAAGRLVKEGGKVYRYGWLDKALSVAGGGKTYTYAYHADGQLARADYGGGRSEDFAWDGLALVRRGDEQFVNEPHIGGGSPVLSSNGVAYLNDLLGTTVGVRDGPRGRRRHTPAARAAFGEPLPGAAGGAAAVSSPFFTGKPDVPGRRAGAVRLRGAGRAEDGELALVVGDARALRRPRRPPVGRGPPRRRVAARAPDGTSSSPSAPSRATRRASASAASAASCSSATAASGLASSRKESPSRARKTDGPRASRGPPGGGARPRPRGGGRRRLRGGRRARASTRSTRTRSARTRSPGSGGGTRRRARTVSSAHRTARGLGAALVLYWRHEKT